jgi:CheY-like chemotaxis protein/HPt (histidine-containing phosphotransfer) domain-containing protein
VSNPQPRFRVLIAEADPGSRQAAADLLGRAGYAVDEATDGAAAVRFAAERPYDLILVALTSSGTDCIEVAQGIRRLDHPRGDVPILVVSAAIGAADKDRCLAAGVDGFLGTPIDPLEWLEAAAHWVDAAEDPHWGLEVRPGVPAPLVNQRTLAYLEEDVGELLPDILVTFLQEVERRLALLAQRVGVGDTAGAADQAHALKGSAATFGAIALRHCVQEMEQIGRAGDVQRLAARLPEVERLVAATCDWLRSQYEFLRP